MDSLDFNILKHVALHRVASRESLATVSPDGTPPDKRVAALANAKQLKRLRGFPGNRTLYQVTSTGAACVGAPESRARPLRAQSLRKHYGVLVFCLSRRAERYRVEEEELRSVLGEPPTDAVHCVSKDRGRLVLFNCYVPGAATSEPTVVRRLWSELKRVSENPAASAMLAAGRYGFAVVVESVERQRAILKALKRPDRAGAAPFVSRARVWVEAAPSLTVLGGMNPSDQAEPDLFAVATPARRPRRAGSTAPVEEGDHDDPR